MRPGDIVPARVDRRSDLLPFLAGRPRHELEFLPAALEIIDTPAPPAARLIPAAICAFFAAAIAWSIVGRMDIVANAPGTVIPAGKVKVVQPVETAAVDAVLVADGDHVAQGQVLVRLDAVSATAERTRIGADLASARLDVAGLSALRDALLNPGRPLAFPVPSGASRDASDRELATVLARYDSDRAKLADLAQQVAERQVELAENASAVDKLRVELPMLAETRDMYRKLTRDGLASRLDLLSNEQKFSDAAHDLATTIAHAGEARAEAASLARQADAQRSDDLHGVLQDLSTAEQKRDEDAAQDAAAVHAVSEAVLRAPVSGTVQQLTVHSIHGVVTPAERLMVIVPDGQRLVVEATVANRDVGFVHTGQRVKIKVAAFPFTRYGLIQGRVLSVSHDAVDDTVRDPDDTHQQSSADANGAKAEDDLDGGQGSGYVARIALDRNTILIDGEHAGLQPGMAVTAEILTGTRRVITYLLSPIMRYAQDAGRER